MRALQGGVPRAWPRHKGPEAYRYREVALALLQRYGPVDALGRRLVKEIALLTLDLDRLHAEADALRRGRKGPKLSQALSRLRRQATACRGQLVVLERRLAEFASSNGHGWGFDLAKAIADAQRQGVRSEAE